MTDHEQDIQDSVWQMIQRGLPGPLADRQPIRPVDIMKPERFVIRELMRKVELPAKKGQ